MEIKILSLTVKNCGALKDIKIDFTDNGKPQSVIVLAGANGSGKTTVLELIFALAELFKFHQNFKDYKLPDFLIKTEYVEIELLIYNVKHSIFFAKKPITYKEIIEKLYRNDNNRYGVVSESYSESMKTWNISKSDFGKKMIRLIKASKDLPITFFNSSSDSNQTETIPSILYFPHNRELFSVKGEQIHREEITYQWCYRYQNQNDFQGSLESYLIWLDYAEPEIFQVVIDFLNQLDFEGKTFYIHRKCLSVMVKTRDGNEHPFNKLSSGEQNILIMLLELRRRLIPGSIVLLDEIENSLHPAFQHRLAQNLLQLQKQIPFQLILTTHQSVFVKIFGENHTRILTEF
jgi:AAA15 family ATPase/GTPase